MQHKTLSLVSATALICGATDLSAAPPAKLDAGADQLVSFPGPVSLKGIVNDTGARRLSIGWMKNQGPGEVSFANHKSAETTATFSEPGEYELMLGGYDGQATWDTVTITVR